MLFVCVLICNVWHSITATLGAAFVCTSTLLIRAVNRSSNFLHYYSGEIVTRSCACQKDVRCCVCVCNVWSVGVGSGSSTVSLHTHALTCHSIFLSLSHTQWSRVCCRWRYEHSLSSRWSSPSSFIVWSSPWPSKRQQQPPPLLLLPRWRSWSYRDWWAARYDDALLDWGIFRWKTTTELNDHDDQTTHVVRTADTPKYPSE